MALLEDAKEKKDGQLDRKYTRQAIQALVYIKILFINNRKMDNIKNMTAWIHNVVQAATVSNRGLDRC